MDGDHRSLLSTLFTIQAVLVVGWWVALFAGDPVRTWFVADGGWSRARSYAPVDLSIVVAPSAAAALGLRAGRTWARHAIVVTEVGVLIGFAVSLWWIAEPVDRWLGAGLMAVMLAGNDLMRRMAP